MLALSIRQPYAELILRGIKTAEYRTRPTRIIGERFYLYASKKSAVNGGAGKKVWSRDLALANGSLPQWMIELAEQVGMIEEGALLPTGVIVGSAVIEKCERIEEGRPRMKDRGSKREGSSIFHPPSSTLDPPSFYRWHLADVRRAKTHRKPKGHPQPVWFTPFD